MVRVTGDDEVVVHIAVYSMQCAALGVWQRIGHWVVVYVESGTPLVCHDDLYMEHIRDGSREDKPGHERRRRPSPLRPSLDVDCWLCPCCLLLKMLLTARLFAVTKKIPLILVALFTILRVQSVPEGEPVPVGWFWVSCSTAISG